MKVRCGFEWHIQLNTSKLFCSCKGEISDNKDYEIHRNLRASSGESGLKDIAASFEELKHREVIYYGSKDSSCLVEADEEPPHSLNKEALSTAIKIANALNCKIFKDIIFMRKVIVDGSNTSGFQRTALIAMNGIFNFKGSEIPINTLMLEEDSARKESENKNSVIYKLDRLGIPLVEIATGVIDVDENQAKEIALEFGKFTRLFNVKRGIGTIRQDVNLSVEGGSRVELKGFQNIREMDKVIAIEAERQYKLLQIIKEKGYLKGWLDNIEIVDVSNVFGKTSSHVVSEAIKNGKIILAVKLVGFKGLLGTMIQPGKTFGSEISSYLRAKYSAGIIHSDELPAYGISQEEVKSIADVLKCDSDDAFFFSFLDNNDLKEKIIIDAIGRIKQLLTAVPSEVRIVNEDNTNSFLRPMGGENRMYIETDLPVITVDENILNEGEKYKGLTLDSLRKKYNLSDEFISLLIDANKLDLAIKIHLSLGVDFKTIISILVNEFNYIKNKFGIEIEDDILVDLIKRVKSNQIAKDSVRFILEMISTQKSLSVDDCIEKYKLNKISTKELVKEVNTLPESVRSNKNMVINELRKKFGFAFDVADVLKILNG